MSLLDTTSKDKLGKDCFQVIRVPHEAVGRLWIHAAPYLMMGLVTAPELTVQQVSDGLVDQSIQLWMVLEGEEDHQSIIAAFLTSVEWDRGEWVTSLYCLGGSRPREWVMKCHRAVHGFAKQMDSERVRLAGRAGWQRILPGYVITGEIGGHYIYERAVGV